ncbi:MAG: DUF2961 domain-containing protein, partial [Armatimonadota bacterium]|nr:DUF2961 domain-containing protein [Armatimonadota bacterium]
DKIVLTLHSGKPLELLRDGRSQYGQYYQKAFVLYPRFYGDIELDRGAMLLATNRAPEANKFFYQAMVISQGGGRGQGSGLRLPAIKQDTSGVLKPGEERTIFAVNKAANIEQIEIRLNPATLQAWRDVRLRAHWGDAPSSATETGMEKEGDAVDMPLLALTGQFFNSQPVENAFCSFNGKTLRLHLLMPLSPARKNQATVRIRNTGSSPIIVETHVATQKDGGPSAYRFCAASGSARTEKGKPVQMLNVAGAGAFVGLALGIEPAPGSPKQTFSYLEGNEIITADGRKYEGTGTEDFFNSAWYFPDKPFAFAYHGMTFKSQKPPRVSAYRLMIPDAVPFKKSFTFEFEHGNGNNTDDLLYRWVAFWYQKPPLQYQVVDALKDGATTGAGTSQPNDNALWKKLFFATLGLVLFVLVMRAVLRLARRS